MIFHELSEKRFDLKEEKAKEKSPTIKEKETRIALIVEQAVSRRKWSNGRGEERVGGEGKVHCLWETSKRKPARKRTSVLERGEGESACVKGR